MTIIYQYRVATASLGGFGKLLLKWQGSVYKLMYNEMAIFMTCYSVISVIYRLLLDAEQRLTFEKLAMHCNSYTSLIPISFVLGFYVSLVVSRWWRQFRRIPWPDRALYTANCYLCGQDERGRLLRRTLTRYLLFSTVLICRSISVAVMKRFPTMGHVIEAGIATKDEVAMYDSVDCDYNKFWVPLLWANSLVAKARKEGRIDSDMGLRMIIAELADFRDKCSLCFMYDWVTIPLVYTQVVTLAVYMFFGACLIGRQFLDPSKGYDNYGYDLYIPVFTVMQFFFYMGWLKVAEQLINPFGEDDDDFDINWLIDRHMSVSMTMVDQCYGQHPPLTKDIHWDDRKISDLPYTEASVGSKRPFYLGSTFNLRRLSAEEQKTVIRSADHRTSVQTDRKSLSRPVSLLSLLSRRSSFFKSHHHASRHCLLPISDSSPILDNPQGDIKPYISDEPKSILLLPPPEGSVAHYSNTPSDHCFEEIMGKGQSHNAEEKVAWSSNPELTRNCHLPIVLCTDTKEHKVTLEENVPWPTDGGDNRETLYKPDKSYSHNRKYSCPVILSSPIESSLVYTGETTGGSLAVSRAPLLSSIEESNTSANPFVMDI